MKHLLIALALVAAPAAAQDAQRGKLLYDAHCGGCHYERVHDRPPGRSSVHSLADLRDEVARRAALVKQRFTRDDLADIVSYLNQSHYRFER
jgi:mono/diheme cytochrome c family protein